MKLGALHTPAPASLLTFERRVALAKLTRPLNSDWFAQCPPDGDELGNDTRGNCVPCAEYRAIQIRLTVAAGSIWKPTTAMTVALYTALTGYNPTTGLPDDGTDTAAAMTAWAKTGIRVNEQLLDLVGWTSVNPLDDGHIALAIANTGPVQVTLALPLTAQDTSTWSQAPGTGPAWVPGSWGYHRVCGGRWQDRALGVRTWGRDVDLHPEWRARYLVAVDATLSRDWMETTGLAPSAVDWDRLEADMQQLAA